MTAAGNVPRFAGIVALFGAIVVTHQLSPYMILGSLICLWLLGILRQPLLILIFAIAIIGYLNVARNCGPSEFPAEWF